MHHVSHYFTYLKQIKDIYECFVKCKDSQTVFNNIVDEFLNNFLNLFLYVGTYKVDRYDWIYSHLVIYYNAENETI